MIIRDIAQLDPHMQPGVKRYLRKCKEAGLEVIVLETRRELSTQIAYFLRSRAPIAIVKMVFERCGLWAINDEQAAQLNTKTLWSKHIDGLAVDIAPAKDGKAWNAAPRSIWMAMFMIAESECGLDACAEGKWEKWEWDWAHHEFKYEVSEF